MELQVDEALAGYRAMPDALEAMLDEVSNETAERPGDDPDDDWSIAAIVSHLVYSERVQNGRMLRILAEETPQLPWVPDSDGVVEPLDVALRVFTEERRAQAALLAETDEAGWRRGGIHERTGPLTVLQLVVRHVAHDVEHLGQIGRRLRALRELRD